MRKLADALLCGAGAALAYIFVSIAINGSYLVGEENLVILGVEIVMSLGMIALGIYHFIRDL